MATIHPSRLGLVPPPVSAALPPRPEPSSSRDPLESTELSREEALRRKLLARRGRRDSEERTALTIGIKGAASSRDLGEGTLRGRELIDTESGGDGRLGSGRREDSSRTREASQDSTPRARGASGARDEEIRRRSYSRELEMRRDSPRRADMDRCEDRRRSPRPDNHRHSRPEDRRDERDRHLHDSRESRDYRDRRDGGSRRTSPSYPHDVPPHLPARPPAEGGQVLPPIWMTSGMPPFPGTNHPMPPFPPQNGMPPFPPNSRPPMSLQNRSRNPPHQAHVNLEQRREERERITLSVWPPSPDRPYQDPEELEEERRAKRKERKKSRKSKRRARYSSSDTESSDSEYERRRRRRKERRKYSEEGDGNSRRSRESRSKSARQSEAVSARDSGEEEQWVEKGGKSVHLIQPSTNEEDEEVGPRLPSDLSGKDRYKTHFKDMLYGEAEAMAAYAADGRRIPRRGEIGLDSETIEKFEEAGYVMSGSRHKRMTAVRLRKENQVINAEEKRAILKLQREEKVRKEGAIVSQFREMLDEKLREGKAEK